MEHVEHKASKNIIKDNIEKLRLLFPEAFTESSDDCEPRWKVDFETLKQILGDYTEEKQERYSFSWNGKSRARLIAQTPSTGTLRPCPGESVDWDSTKNLFIEGDNLEVLKLLQKSYHKKVKMIYIDPPYNTGNEFIYPDKFQDNLDTYLRYTGQVDDEGFKVSTNSETGGRYHTNWLNMMYPRLKLARNLLRDDGVIFISIDDNEVANLRKVCDEIFGEENFLVSIVWEKRFTRSNNAKMFATLTENMLCYRKSSKLEYLREPRDEKANSIYSNPDNDMRGPWTSVSYVNPATKEQRPNLVYSIKNPITGQIVNHPTNAWKYEKSTHEAHVQEKKLYWGKNGENTYPRLKKFIYEMEDGMVPVDLWARKTTGTTDEGSKELQKLLGAKVFDFPKPHSLIKRAIRIVAEKDNIILDFFAGSCPTAHAVFKQNVENQQFHKFIIVQLPEPTMENSEAYKACYKTIAEIGKERIRRAGKKIREENPDYDGDLGF
ncbi:MAG: site-specific DNA-methyltransferase [Spirochaetia bacterium]